MSRLRSTSYHLAMGIVSFLWVAPILWVIVISFRSFDDVAANGLGSLPSGACRAAPFIGTAAFVGGVALGPAASASISAQLR